MKIKLYFVQEIYSASNPEDCVGPLVIFTEEKERDFYMISHVPNEWVTYQTFDKDIEI